MAVGTRFRGCTTSKVQLAAVLVVLLLAVEMPVSSVARFMVLNSTTVTARGNLESAAQEGFAIDLMQYHHVDSPYATPNLTLAQRVEIAVKSSQERAEFFHEQIYGKQSGSKFGAEDVLSSPVFSSQGSYVMQIELGTPSRTFVAIADTGSDLVWVQCSTCTSCFQQPDAIFNPQSSSSYKALPCSNNALCADLPTVAQPCSATSTCLYQYAYGDMSSTQGDFASETVGLPTTTGSTQSFPNFGFGCGHRNKGTFASADGLVGLGQGPLSIVAQLGPQVGNVFSYCLVDFYSATTKTSPLLLGGTGGGALSYTPLLTNSANPSFYYVNVVGITVGGTAIQYPSGTFAIDATGNGGLILDSGTTVTQLDSAAYTPFQTRLASLIGYPQVDGSSAGFDLCYDLSNVANPTFPAVVFQFQNVNLALPADNVFLQVDNAGTFCLAFQGANLGLSIFGNVQQQNFQIAYDRANKRVGFLSKTC